MHHRDRKLSNYARFSALGLVCLAMGACASKPACEDEVTAFVMANQFVERQLKAPSTASFPTITADGVVVARDVSDKGAKCAFIVATYVDAENSFGATIRERFTVKLSPDDDSGSRWTLEMISN